VGSIEFVHRRIVQQRDQGLAVLLISSELDEIYALSDRIAVMYEGRITGFRPPDVPAEELGMLMAGASDADAAAASAAVVEAPAGGPDTGLMASGLLGVGVPTDTTTDPASSTPSTPADDQSPADDDGGEPE
jgi:simple sugar transport system ATP-binding protein